MVVLNGMELDRLFFKIRGGNQIYGDKISFEDLVTKKFSYCEDSEELVVVFSCWGGSLKSNVLVRRNLLRDGCSVLEYEFPEGILSSVPEFTSEYFDSIKNEVVRDIERLRREFSFSRVSVVGVSIGCVNACMIANVVDVERLFLILPGSSLAEAVWSGIGTQEIRREYEGKGVSLEDLKECWKGLTPENNVDNLNCEVFVYRSDKDLVILPKLGARLVSKIGNVDCRVDSWMGHYLSVLVFWVFPGRFLRG